MAEYDLFTPYYKMEILLRCAGYKMMKVYGGFEKQPYDFKSGIMVFVAQSQDPMA